MSGEQKLALYSITPMREGLKLNLLLNLLRLLLLTLAYVCCGQGVSRWQRYDLWEDLQV
jgi:hypothetical protein